MWEATIALNTDALSPSAFQSTPPVWEATINDSLIIATACDFNPRLPCGRRRYSPFRLSMLRPISIHASRVGGDVFCCCSLSFVAAISIHASRVGGDTPECVCTTAVLIFQSTPPVWEATTSIGSLNKPQVDFNPRLPCGRRQRRLRRYAPPQHFNPRLPCGRRPQKSMKNGRILWNFC